MRVDEDDNTYYLYDKAIVNGKSESVKAASNATFSAPGLYHSVRYDENEFVDDADLALDPDEDYIVNTSLSGAAVAGEGGTVEVGGTSMRLADEFVIRVVTSDNKMVTIKDAEALNNRYKNKVVDGELWAALKDDEVTTLILVVDSVGDPPSGSAAVKAVYESTSAVTDAAVTTVTATSSIAGVTVDLSSATEADKMNTVKTALAADGTFNSAWTVSEPDSTTKVITVTKKVAGVTTNPDSNFFVEKTAGVAAVPAVAAVYNSGTVTKLDADGDLEIGGYSSSIVVATQDDLAKQLAKFVADYNADGANTEWTVAINDASDGIKFTAKTAGAIGQTGPANAPTGATEVTEGAEEIAAVAAVYTLDPSKVLLGGSAMEIHGKKYAVTGADLAEKLAAWVQAYKSDSGNTEWDAAVKAGELKVVFTAKTAGALATTGATAPTDTTEVTAGADAVTP